MSLSFIFSPDSREVFACFLKTVARPLCDTRTTFVRMSQKFHIVNWPKFRSDRFPTLARMSCDSHATVLRNFLAKVRIKFLNMFKTFATSSQHMKILTTLVPHSHECRAKFRNKVRKTVERNSHASEILALL